MANELDIVDSEFELLSHYNVHFRTNAPRKRYKPPTFPWNYGLNSTIAILQVHWYKITHKGLFAINKETKPNETSVLSSILF